MNNKQNDLVKYAIKKIKCDQKCRPNRFTIIGPFGPTGPSGIALNYADFYALMPPDNSVTVAPGTDVSFPQDGPNSGASIT